MEQNEQEGESDGYEDSNFWQQGMEENEGEEGNDEYECLYLPPLVSLQTTKC